MKLTFAGAIHDDLAVFTASEPTTVAKGRRNIQGRIAARDTPFRTAAKPGLVVNELWVLVGV